jgi:hypothetical protein
MPVRRLSVGGVAFMSTLALLAAGGVAAARSHGRGARSGSKSAPAKTNEPPKPDADEAGEDAAAQPEAEPRSEPKPRPEPKPRSEPKPESKREPSLEAPPPAPEVTVDGEPVARAAPPAPVARAIDVEPANPSEAIVGFSDRLFIRSPGGEVVVFPGGRVQVDAAAFPRQTPKSGAFIRRARVELTGWLGRIFYFDVSADFAPVPPAGDVVAPSALPAADNYVALAPVGNRFILQAGLFDAPFTLANRTSDAYTDFIERPMAARSVGVPRNKEVGAMVHGLLAEGVFYYSGGVFNGDGPDFRNLDNQPDVIGRMTVSPFARGEGAFRRLTLGGSGWYGRHVLAPGFPVQATPGGIPFVMPQWTTGQGPLGQSLELREHGIVTAVGGELSIPFGRHFGLRGEAVYKQQRLAETEAAPLTGPLTVMGTPQLNALSAYGEMWLWLAADDQMLPTPGLELPNRTDGRYTRAFEDGLMLAFRGEFVKEDLVNTQTALADPTRATTRVISGTAGVNYWRGHFARISINYVANMWSGTSETIKTLRAPGLLEHEVLLRFASSL